jgi:hypothetical protein
MFAALFLSYLAEFLLVFLARSGTSPEVPRRPAEVLARTQAEGDG